MEEATVNIKHRRRPWLAIMLSLMMPGVGHVYCGRLVRGLVLAFFYGIAMPAIFGLLAYLGPVPTAVFTVLLLAATFGVVIIAVIDCYVVARRTKSNYELKGYNHLVVYLLLGLLIQGSCLGYALHIRERFFEAFSVPAPSEYPSIIPGDRILVDKTAYKRDNPQRGDIVVFHPPDGNWRLNYIKRVVAIAGDTVEFKDGRLYINDEELPHQELAQSVLDNIRIKVRGELLEGEVFEEINGNVKYKIFLAEFPHKQTSSDFAKTTVPKHHCFVVGDNRNLSLDSRHFGSIPLSTVIGRADYLYWPVKDWFRFGKIKD